MCRFTCGSGSLCVPSTASIPPLAPASLKPLPTSFSFLCYQWRMKNSVCLVARSASSQNFRVLANSTVSPGKGTRDAEVIMVDPLEAKRLAAKQMEMLKAKQKFKRQRQIEAINGAWAIIGLTAGFVIEGRTGNGILAQLTGYWMEIFAFLKKIIPL